VNPAPTLTLRLAARDAAGRVNLDADPSQIASLLADTGSTFWLDVDDPGPDHGEALALLRDTFQFHPLAVDDALNECHVPRVDDWGAYLYLVVQAIDPTVEELTFRELDVFLGPNYLLTYHSGTINAVEAVRRDLARDVGGRLGLGADHVLYLVLDHTVAEFLTAIGRLDEAIDRAQDEVFDSPSPATLKEIFRIKRQAIHLQRTISPQREVLNRLARDHYGQIDDADRVYFRDVYDHHVRLHDISETLRDLISGALDTYLSALSNRTNEVMKTLTFVTVMFLPMSFLAGFFGMNFFGEPLAFRALPTRGGLFWACCLVMASTPVVIWFWSKRRGWF